VIEQDYIWLTDEKEHLIMAKKAGGTVVIDLGSPEAATTFCSLALWPG